VWTGDEVNTKKKLRRSGVLPEFMEVTLADLGKRGGQTNEQQSKIGQQDSAPSPLKPKEGKAVTRGGKTGEETGSRVKFS